MLGYFLDDIVGRFSTRQQFDGWEVSRNWLTNAVTCWKVYDDIHFLLPRRLKPHCIASCPFKKLYQLTTPLILPDYLVQRYWAIYLALGMIESGALC
jgi:hypothetical protein